MGFVEPLALVALPLALVPLLLARRWRRRGEPVPFSSLYLVERARREPRRTRGRSRPTVLLRCLVVLLLVLAAARPVGPGRGDPALHLPTRAIVAVDVSASAARLQAGAPLWPAIRAAADSVLAAASTEDRMALAAVADGLVGWWEGDATVLRRRLARLAPTARTSDWPAVLAALAARAEEGTETYLLTDGSRGARAPAGDAGIPAGHRALRVFAHEAAPNRSLAGVRWTDAGAVALVGRAWGRPAPVAATAGRRVGGELREPATIPLDGDPSPTRWAVADTATFALDGADALAVDDMRWVARGRSPGPYRIVRWAPGDEPSEPGTLFWEAALEASGRGVTVERVGSLAALAAAAPDLALLPLRGYRRDQAALLAGLAADGTRLLFAPSCPDPACAPPPGWLAGADLAAPELAWRPEPAGRASALAPGPTGEPNGAPPPLPGHLLARAPIRGALAPGPAPPAEWRWDLAGGASAAWARGPVAIWLVPLGPPFTRIGATPLFPLVVDAMLAAWDPRWSADGADVPVGAPLPVEGPARVVGPLHAGDRAREWRVAEGGPPPRPEAPGFYRVEPGEATAPGVRAAPGAATFVAVNGDPAEGDLSPVGPGTWEAAWGAPPVAAEAWADALFPRRRGPDLWPWLVVLALAGLVAEAALRRARVDK